MHQPNSPLNLFFALGLGLFLLFLANSSSAGQVHQVVGPMRSTGSTMTVGVIVRHEFAANDPRYYAAQVPVDKPNFASKLRNVARPALRGTVPGLLAWAIIEGIGWAYNTEDELVSVSTSPGSGEYVLCQSKQLPRLGGTAQTFSASGPIPCFSGDRVLVDDYAVVESFKPVSFEQDLGQQWMFYSLTDTHSVQVNVWSFEDTETSVWEAEAPVTDEDLLQAVQTHYADDVAVNTDLFRDPNTGTIEQSLFNVPAPTPAQEAAAVSDATLVNTGDLGVTGPAPGTESPGEIVVDLEFPDFCTWAAWLCEPPELGEQPEIPTLDIETPTYDSGLPVSATCPAPVPVVTTFGTWEISFQFACDLASAIRTPLIAISYLMSAFIVVGVRK